MTEHNESGVAATRAVTQPISDDLARAEAIEKTSLAIADACEAERPGRRCEVESFFFGARLVSFSSFFIILDPSP